MCPTYVFEEISTKRTRYYIDSNGKRRQKTKAFSQTVNPFNKNKDGSRKTVEQIKKEIHAEAEAWMKLSDRQIEAGK